MKSYTVTFVCVCEQYSNILGSLEFVSPILFGWPMPETMIEKLA
jgi:hypothetical protein